MSIRTWVGLSMDLGLINAQRVSDISTIGFYKRKVCFS